MISYISTKGRSQFKTCEDSLTSSVIDYLMYLPTPIFWDLLKKSMYQQKLPEHSGEIKSIEYWPSWNAEDTENSQRVEPDVFLQFEDFDVLIEAKRYNLGGQDKIQFENEVQSYQNEYGEQNKTLYFIKLGGLNNLEDEEDREPKIIICKTDWSKLLNEIILLKKEFELGNRHLNQHYIRLLNDCIKGFSLHNFHDIQWLKNLSTLKINITKISLNKWMN